MKGFDTAAARLKGDLGLRILEAALRGVVGFRVYKGLGRLVA